MLIGIAGRAGSGKDTAADIIIRELGSGVTQKIRFSEPVKRICRDVFGWNNEHTDGALKDVVDPLTGISPRIAMQTLGTDWGRKLRKNTWIDLLMRSYRDKISTNTIKRNGGSHIIERTYFVVVPDVRFADEAAAIREELGIVLHISRNGTNRMSHASEVECDSPAMLNHVNYMIDNSGDIDNLEQQIKTVVCALRSPLSF